jgi:hypothetical protein
LVLGLVGVAVVGVIGVVSLVVRRRRRSHGAHPPAMREIEQAIIDLRAEADATDDALRRAADRRAS